MPACPVSSLDPFADDFLTVPYSFYAELREAGPVVWLERYGLWVCARHAEVQAALSDWQTFSSAAGVGIDDFRRTKPWRPPSLILEADPPLHGTGAAGRLMQDIVDHARAQQLVIEPRCSYARAWFARHPEAQDVLD